MTLPKEYYLEEPANYNYEIIRLFVIDLSTGIGLFALNEHPELLITVFNTNEHQKIAQDICQYLFDTQPSIEPIKFIHEYMLGLFKAGFFG